MGRDSANREGFTMDVAIGTNINRVVEMGRFRPSRQFSSLICFTLNVFQLTCPLPTVAHRERTFDSTSCRCWVPILGTLANRNSKCVRSWCHASRKSAAWWPMNGPPPGIWQAGSDTPEMSNPALNRPVVDYHDWIASREFGIDSQKDCSKLNPRLGDGLRGRENVCDAQ